MLLITWVASGDCWPMLDADNSPNLKITRDTPPVGSTTANSNGVIHQTVRLSREINTTLAGLVFLLTAGSYWLLMGYTTPLSNEIILPSKLLEKNLAAVLSLTWPKKYMDSPGKISDFRTRSDWVLFDSGTRWREKESDLYGPAFYKVHGAEDNIYPLTERQPRTSFIVFVKAFSPVMKSLVQIAVWNAVSFWLVLVMIVTTLAYNGFMTHNTTNDSILRIVLVVAYAFANFGHQYYTATLLYRNFTLVLFQVCWTFICKQFIFLPYKDYEKYALTHELIPIRDNNGASDYFFVEDLYWAYCYRDRLAPGASLMRWSTFNFELFGTTEYSDGYRVVEGTDQIGHITEHNVFETWSADDKRRDFFLKARDKTESKFDKLTKPIREAEIKACEKATDSALEKTLANIAVLLGICLATGLAPWTSTPTSDATSAQLGSYALLLSISTGLLALISSATQLTSATESTRTLLRLQEKTIAADPDEDQGFSIWDKPCFGFSSKEGVSGQTKVTPRSLRRSASLFGKLLCLLLGSALMLIPRFHRHHPRVKDPDNPIMFKVHDTEFGSSNHGSDWGGLYRVQPNSGPSEAEVEQK